MRTIIFRCLILVLVTGGLDAARAGDGGSAYSLLGIGDLRYWPNARSAGMGFTGIALPAQNTLNASAPATWARIGQTRLEAGALYEGFNTSDGISSRYLARVDFNGATLSLPIAPSRGIVVAAGLVPYSRINFDTYNAATYTGPTDTLSYSIHYKGSGGISRAFLGTSWAPASTLSFGFSFNYLFGSRDQSRELVPHTSGFTGNIEEESNSVSGVTYTLGALFTGSPSLGSVLRPLSLGFYVTSRGRLNTRNQTIYTFGPSLSATELDTTSLPTGDLVVPFTYGVGMAYQVSDRYVLAADYVAEPWQSSEFNGAHFQGVRDGYRIGIGAERLALRELGAPWREHLSLRLGAYYHSTYIQVGGVGIVEYGITGGITLPLYTDPRFGSESSLTLALEYAHRAPASGSLIKDSIWRCTASFVIGELWFVRSEED